MSLFILSILILQFFVLSWNLLYWRRRKLTSNGAVIQQQLSVLIPARDEQHQLPRLIESLHNQTHAPLEIIVCDDESDDGTREWLSGQPVNWFQSAPRPTGWIGKNWACHQLGLKASGDWLIFLDADLRLEPDFLRKIAIHLNTTHGALITAIPKLRPATFPVGLLKVWLPFTTFTLLPLYCAEQISNPAFAFANGQIMIFRQSDYLSWLPHQTVKGEILEDVAIAALVKRMKGHVSILDAKADVSVSMYLSFREASEGFAKNAVAICRGVGMSLVVFNLMTVVYLFPLVDIAAHGLKHWHLIAVLLSVNLFGLSAKMGGLKPTAGLLYPCSIVLGLVVLARSILWYTRGKVYWKGRGYDIKIKA